MNNAESEGEWEDRWEVAWTEFDWERYTRQQDESIRLYLAFYDEAKASPDRIDEAARQMGWEFDVAEGDDASGEDSEDEEDLTSGVPYTLHKHPVYVATKALYLSLQRTWERMMVDFPALVAPSLQVGMLGSLHRGELNSVMAIQSLDVGEYTLAVSQFKRALADLNESLRHLEEMAGAKSKTLEGFRSEARMRLFDLREIWLRVMADCRSEQDGFEDEGPG